MGIIRKIIFVFSLLFVCGLSAQTESDTVVFDGDTYVKHIVTVGESIKDNGYFEIHKSSNKVDFMGYMARLRTQMTTKPGEEKPVLVLDNLGAHCGEPKRKLMRTFCKPEYTPTYSCELNGPIETCWAILKKRVLTRWTKLLIRKAGNKSKLKAIVRDELHRKIDKQIYANVCRSHYPYL